MNALTPVSVDSVRIARSAADARRDRRLVAVTFGLSTAYASVRYNVFKGVPWSDWPVYTLNKAIGVEALTLLVAGVWSTARGRSPGQLLAWAGAAVLVHVAASLTILNPTYFSKFFENGKLTIAAGLSLMIGCAAAAGMEVGARKSGALTFSQRAWALAAIAGASGVHAGMTGLPAWLNPHTWPGGLPPITLISALLGCAAISIVGLFSFGQRRHSQRRAVLEHSPVPRWPA